MWTRNKGRECVKRVGPFPAERLGVKNGGRKGCNQSNGCKKKEIETPLSQNRKRGTICQGKGVGRATSVFWKTKHELKRSRAARRGQVPKKGQKRESRGTGKTIQKIGRLRNQENGKGQQMGNWDSMRAGSGKTTSDAECGRTEGRKPARRGKVLNM